MVCFTDSITDIQINLILVKNMIYAMILEFKVTDDQIYFNASSVLMLAMLAVAATTMLAVANLHTHILCASCLAVPNNGRFRNFCKLFP